MRRQLGQEEAEELAEAAELVAKRSEVPNRLQIWLSTFSTSEASMSPELS